MEQEDFDQMVHELSNVEVAPGEEAVQPVPAEAVANVAEVVDGDVKLVHEKPVLSLELLNDRLNLVYKEMKRYLQLRNDQRELDVLAEAFKGEGV